MHSGELCVISDSGEARAFSAARVRASVERAFLLARGNDRSHQALHAASHIARVATARILRDYSLVATIATDIVRDTIVEVLLDYGHYHEARMYGRSHASRHARTMTRSSSVTHGASALVKTSRR